MTDRSDYIAIISRKIISRKMYKRVATSPGELAAFVEEYAWQSRSFKAYYLTMTDRSLKLFETAVLKRVGELEKLGASTDSSTRQV